MNLIEQIKVNDVSIDGYQGTYYTESPEWIKVLTDAQDKIVAGVRKDGSVYIGELQIPASLQSSIDTLTAESASLDERLQTLESIISITQNPEFIQVTTDSEGKILQSRNPEGVNKEYVGIETPSLKVNDIDITDIKTELKKELPGYMIPKTIKIVDKLPMNENNKPRNQVTQLAIGTQHRTTDMIERTKPALPIPFVLISCGFSGWFMMICVGLYIGC